MLSRDAPAHQGLLHSKITKVLLDEIDRKNATIEKQSEEIKLLRLTNRSSLDPQTIPLDPQTWLLSMRGRIETIDPHLFSKLKKVVYSEADSVSRSESQIQTAIKNSNTKIKLQHDLGVGLEVLDKMTLVQLEDHVKYNLVPTIVRQLSTGAQHRAAGRGQRQSTKQRQRKSTRSKFRLPLPQYIGPAPSLGSPEHWKTEHKWDELMSEIAKMNEQTLEELYKISHYRSADAWLRFWDGKGKHANAVACGFKESQAEVLSLLFSGSLRKALALATQQESDRYASMTHSLYNTISMRAAELKQPAPKCYWWLKGRSSLADADPRWMDIENFDSAGWRGLTTFGTLKLVHADEKYYTPNGLKYRLGKSWQTMDSPVVCFESEESKYGKVLHSAVKISKEGEFVLPPLTSLEVKEVQNKFEFLPGKWMQQKLITVRPTFMLPVELQNSNISIAPSRFQCGHNILRFGVAQDHAQGLEQITDGFVLTMEQEWARNDLWDDWKGIRHNSQQEWQYVTGVADGDVAERDADHKGWALKRFHSEINNHVKRQLANNAGLRVRLEKLGIREDDILLALSEVIAIRLYTGPGFWAINRFLREVFKLNAEWQHKVAHMHNLTYSATVFHLTNGLRKLVRVNTEEQNQAKLFRGIRGKLPAEFWYEDAFGCVTATDFGFMSTTVDEKATYPFFEKMGGNVLWELTCDAETSDGFHSGADVSLLSQYANEQEILFPPLTMMTVVAEQLKQNTRVSRILSDGALPLSSQTSASQRSTTGTARRGINIPDLDPEHTKTGANFVRIKVIPTFV